VVTTTVPIGDLSSGSVVIWNEDAAKQLFDALASDSPIPQDVLDAAHQ
jgi:hypothetical protein